MFPLPFDKFTISTKKSKDIIIEQIKRVVEDGNSCFQCTGDNGKFFIGKFKDNSFKISPIVRTGIRNSFTPVLKICFADNESNTEVNIFARMSLFAIVFMSIWLGMGFFSALMSVFLLINQAEFVPFIISVVMLILGSLLMCVSFWLSYSKAKKLLTEIIKE
ncbi:MAG: hypothetical protein U0L76_06295 [Ruminococcus sp.]|nr:hypothetical protein [Ruminococcus sp.]